MVLRTSVLNLNQLQLEEFYENNILKVVYSFKFVTNNLILLTVDYIG